MRALSAAGIGVTAQNMEVEVLVFAASDLPIALSNGSIDAFAAMDPSVSVAVRDNNLKVLLDTATSPFFRDEYCCAAFVTSDFAEKHPDAAEKYTRAIMKASLWVGEHPAETARLQVENSLVAGDADFNATLLAGYNFIPSVENGYESLQRTFVEFQKIGAIRPSTDTKKLAESSYLFFE
jgi:NitT/TauT family transport system substrate-binding protein